MLSGRLHTNKTKHDEHQSVTHHDAVPVCCPLASLNTCDTGEALRPAEDGLAGKSFEPFPVSVVIRQTAAPLPAGLG